MRARGPSTRRFAVALALLVVVAGACPAQAWWQLSPLINPNPRDGAAIAYDEGRRRTVMWGGAFDPRWAAAVMEWDGTTWTWALPPVGPPLRRGAAMVYDVARRKCVLFGGIGSSASLLDDTWEWDGTAWTRATPVNRPAPRYGHAMVYDRVRGHVVLFGGRTLFDWANDTWTWDGTAWTRVLPTTSPPARGEHAMVYDEARGRPVLFGGEGATLRDDTWEWQGSTWIRRTPAATPPARAGHAMVYDRGRGRAVLFGGRTTPSARLGDTWEWDGTNWLPSSSAGGPSARAGHAMAHDPARQRTLLVGGDSADETWAFAATRIGTANVARLGTTVAFALQASADVGRPYRVVTGFGSGPTNLGPRTIDVVQDAAFIASATGALPAVFVGYAGVLDGAGAGVASLRVPPFAALSGQVIFTAFVTLDPAAPLGIRSVSNAVRLSIMP